MIDGKRVWVIIPGFRVARTIERTVRSLPAGFADEVLFVDDGGADGAVEIARALGVRTIVHPKNRGYGAAQKTAYREALAGGADVVVMVHGDYQYKPELAPVMAGMVAYGGYDLVLGSRLLVRGAIKGGMPVWKYVANRALTATENVMLGAGLSEYHSGYRAFSRRLLEALPLAANRDDYVFDNQVIAQTLEFGFTIGEISCPAHYFDGMGTITFWPGVRYGLGCLAVASELVLHRTGVRRSPRFVPARA